MWNYVFILEYMKSLVNPVKTEIIGSLFIFESSYFILLLKVDLIVSHTKFNIFKVPLRLFVCQLLYYTYFTKHYPLAESATLAFNGTQHMTIWMGGQQGSRTQTEELILRFKTARPMGLLLLTSADSNSPDRLEIALVAGRIRASVRLGEREKVRNRFSTRIPALVSHLFLYRTCWRDTES